MQMGKMDALVSFLVQHGTYINPCLINEHTALLHETKQFEMDDYHLLMDDPNLRYVPLTATLSSLSFFHELRSHSAALGPFPFAESVGSRRARRISTRVARNARVCAAILPYGREDIRGSTRPGRLACLERGLVQELQLLVDAWA